MVCRSLLAYHDKAEELTCIYCGRIEHGHISCRNGHYVCDACHNRDSMQIIEDIAFTIKLKDPFEIAELMMGYPDLPMLGCQHAYIAAGAIMAALRNSGSRTITDDDIREVFNRTAKQAHGGYCGLTGVCGIAPAIGACYAVLTGSRCGEDAAQRVTMEAVTRSSRAITELTGPSCCRAYVWTSLETAVNYLRESLGIELPLAENIACRVGFKHPHGCRETKCPYFDKEVTVGTTEPSLAEKGGYMDFRGSSMTVTTEEGKESMEALLKRALELGAEKARIIDPSTIVVEEWVRWKCQYGCQLYEKDAYHPPCAPAAESTKKVLHEYSKAILMNGPRGKELTEAVVKLEGEAYHRGYYKAFAMTALSSGPEGAA